MNAERMGIYVSIIVLVAVLGVAAVSSGDFDLGVEIGEIKLPQINAGTSTDTSKYAYYEWCYAMGKADC